MDWLSFEDSWLAPYAMLSRASRGRRYLEEDHPYRTIFQRDRDRIIHSKAFRRLMGKTQVLAGHINDHHRTRLTHTLEVAQISRTIAHRLHLNEDLTEAIALAHDLGHPPFGHAGERALNECLCAEGGFDHNLYGLRRVDLLESRYPNFPGLNLSWEVREAFVQHSGRAGSAYAEWSEAGRPLLEAQVVDAADSLAYDTHDTDDALGTGLITLKDLDDVELWRRAAESVRRKQPDLPDQAFRIAVIHECVSRQVNDLLAQTERRILDQQIDSIAAVRAQPDALVGFSEELRVQKADLERFLQERVYRHHRVLRMAAKGQSFLRKLFEEFFRSPELLPERHLLRWRGAPEHLLRRARALIPPDQARDDSLKRVIGDYLAGMTDRFAEQEYLHLFHPDGDL